MMQQGVPDILVVDAGNTSAHLAVVRGNAVIAPRRLPSGNLTRSQVRRAIASCAGRRRIAGAILCSVVPAQDRLWLAELERVAGGRGQVLKMGCQLKMGITVDCPFPSKIGADRLVNAAEASFLLGVPAIAVDFGTAVTFDAVSRGNAFIGGVIVPGPMLMAGSLADKTALLPAMTQDEIGPALERMSGVLPRVARHTRAAMLAGLKIGCLGLFREITANFQRDSRLKGARVCATGGYAKWILARSGLNIRIEPFLTLRGLARIYRLNV